MNGEPDNQPDHLSLEDDPELWQLLGRARKPEASPYFVRRVLRDTASLPQAGPAFALWRGLQAWWQAGLPLLRPPRAAAWSGAFAALLICTASVLMNFSNGAGMLRVSPASERWQPAESYETGPGPISLSTPGADPQMNIASLSAQAANNAMSAAGADDDTLSQQDAEVIADLDSLMSREENHLWTDDNAAF